MFSILVVTAQVAADARLGNGQNSAFAYTYNLAGEVTVTSSAAAVGPGGESIDTGPIACGGASN